MATTKQTGEETRASQGRGQSSREMQRRDQGLGGMQRRQEFASNLFTPFGLGPFSLIRRMQEDIDRLLSNTFASPGQGQQTQQETAGFLPPAETIHRGNDFVIRLDLPGVDADSVEVDVSEDAITIRGERRFEREDERDGVYVSEVSYGSFQRVVPLPTGAVVEDAKARLVNGVLEIVVPAPSQEAQRGRRLEIQRGASEGSESGQQRGAGERSESGQRRS